jgi:hypothetical protein
MLTIRKIRINQLAVALLLILGLICILFSALYVSSYLAILGVSLVFWGGILLYIKPFKQVPMAYVTTSTTTNMSNLERLLSALDFSKSAIYLPPKYLHDTDASLICIPKNENQYLPQPEETNVELLNSKRDGLFLTPPGYALSKFFEQKLGASFTTIDLQNIQKILSRLLIEDLSLGESIDVQIRDNEITIKLDGNVFSDDCRESQKYPKAHGSIGCLMSSSLACVLAKTVGKPIVIHREVQSENSTMIQYMIIGE